MNENGDMPTRPAAAGINAESPARWVIHCICCEHPVEPWQSTGYAFGYCARCFTILIEPGLMEPEGKS